MNIDPLHQKRDRNKNVILTCKRCGVPFHPKHGRESTSLWCSVDCMGVGRRRTEDRLRELFQNDTVKSGDCWIWSGHVANHGYGVVCLNGKQLRAHRVAYTLFCGPIEPGLVVCHRCDVPQCVNPDHLFVGTVKDNAQDMSQKDRHKFGLATGGHKNRKLTPEQVQQIRSDMRPQRTIAKEYGINQANIWAIKNRKSYANVA